MEVELKFIVLDAAAMQAIIVDPGGVLPGVVPVGPVRIVEFQDQYVDTLPGALRASGLIARIRTGAGARRFALKSLVRPGPGSAHRRLEIEGDASAGDNPRGWPPSAAREHLLDLIGDAPLTTIVRLSQRRRQRDVRVGESVVELSLDAVVVQRRQRGPESWIELECELRSGSETDLDGLAGILAKRPDLAPATTSKFERALAAAAADPTRILVLCTGNSCRSQMAEAFLARAGGTGVSVTSAGTHPSSVHPMTIQVLAERGIDWQRAQSKAVTEFLDQPFDVVVTVCDEAAEICPVFPGGGRHLHAGFEDPATVTGTEDVRLAAFRRIRDEVEAWAEGFVTEELRPSES